MLINTYFISMKKKNCQMIPLCELFELSHLNVESTQKKQMNLQFDNFLSLKCQMIILSLEYDQYTIFCFIESNGDMFHVVLNKNDIVQQNKEEIEEMIEREQDQILQLVLGKNFKN